MIGGVADVEWLEGCVWIIELLLVFLMPAYFFFMVRETVPIDMTSCVSKIVDVRSDVLVDFLVMLARVVDAVPPSSPLEGLSIITQLIGETTSTRATIGSWHNGSANRAHRVGRSLILVDLIGLAVRRFKNGSDLDDLRCLQEPVELVGGHGQVGTWGLVDIMAVNMDKFVIKVSLEWAWPPFASRAIHCEQLRPAQWQPHLLGAAHGWHSC